jgi:hypothetical protein
VEAVTIVRPRRAACGGLGALVGVPALLPRAIPAHRKQSYSVLFRFFAIANDYEGVPVESMGIAARAKKFESLQSGIQQDTRRPSTVG